MGQVLVGKELSEMEEMLGDGRPRYRARQIYEAVYCQLAAGWDAISPLPKALRSELSAQVAFGLPEIAQRFTSRDGACRYLLTLEDGKTVESVMMPEGARMTACISTQVGCPVDCKFCLTALMGLERNLTAGEIAGQVLVLLREHQWEHGADRFNIVMMGMGEPLLNLQNVLKATRLLTDPQGMAISPRRITLSTSGIIPKIVEMGQAPERPKLAISLNASTEKARQELMPITRKYPLADLLKACRSYPLRPWEKLTFEYVLLAGVNDSDADARRVVRLLANLNCKVNLIALNPGPGIPFHTPAPERVLAFQQIVRGAAPCFVRKPRGLDIYAACGQLKRVSASEMALHQITVAPV